MDRGTFALFVTDVVLQGLAILIDFKYIVLLESTGLEIMDNVSQFWRWFPTDFTSLVASATERKIETESSSSGPVPVILLQVGNRW